jgi:predicted lipid-binding transport protein (Tim44 family)
VGQSQPETSGETNLAGYQDAGQERQREPHQRHEGSQLFEGTGGGLVGNLHMGLPLWNDFTVSGEKGQEAIESRVWHKISGKEE